MPDAHRPGRVLVTGATGFVGECLHSELLRRGYRVRAAVRQESPALRQAGREQVVVGPIDDATDWQAALSGVQCVVHLAARVHVMRETAGDPRAAFRQVNVAGTERLARQAAAAGVRRMVYISSIKVNGERTGIRPFTEADVPQPEGPYAQSKLEAEQALQRIAAATGLETVILRPPLVYGPKVKGNLRTLLRAVQLGLPLPLGRCENRRSLLGLTNFVDLIALCVGHPAAADQVFVAADDEDLSTPELIRRLAGLLHRPARLLPIPASWLRTAARLLGRQSVYERLCGSLRVDASKARSVLGWRPVCTVDAELARTAAWYARQS